MGGKREPKVLASKPVTTKRSPVMVVLLSTLAPLGMGQQSIDQAMARMLCARIWIAQVTMAGFRWLSARQIEGPQFKVDTFQIDLITRF